MRVVIQSSYRGGVCRFYFSMKENVYFNIRGEESVIQASLRGGECNLLNKKIMFIYRDRVIGTSHSV